MTAESKSGARKCKAPRRSELSRTSFDCAADDGNSLAASLWHKGGLQTRPYKLRDRDVLPVRGLRDACHMRLPCEIGCRSGMRQRTGLQRSPGKLARIKLAGGGFPAVTRMHQDHACGCRGVPWGSRDIAAQNFRARRVAAATFDQPVKLCRCFAGFLRVANARQEQNLRCEAEPLTSG
jgi:hypothetical protein